MTVFLPTVPIVLIVPSTAALDVVIKEPAVKEIVAKLGPIEVVINHTLPPDTYCIMQKKDYKP